MLSKYLNQNIVIYIQIWKATTTTKLKFQIFKMFNHKISLYLKIFSLSSHCRRQCFYFFFFLKIIFKVSISNCHIILNWNSSGLSLHSLCIMPKFTITTFFKLLSVFSKNCSHFKASIYIRKPSCLYQGRVSCSW